MVSYHFQGDHEHLLCMDAFAELLVVDKATWVTEFSVNSLCTQGLASVATPTIHLTFI